MAKRELAHKETLDIGKIRKDNGARTKCRQAREGTNSARIKTQMYNRDEDGTEAKTQFETQDANVQ